MKVKILCLNLYRGGLFWENIQKFFLREKPDILCLQEVFNGDDKQPINFQSISRLRSLFPSYSFYYSPELCEIWPNGRGDGGNAVFSRFPIIEKSTIFLHRTYQRIVRPKLEDDFSHYPKNMQQVVVDIGGKKLNVFNLHGVWGKDGVDNPERLRTSKIIVKEIKGKVPALLMGDFNMKPDTQSIFNIEEHTTNVFKGDLETSFNMKHKTNPGYATAVVDMFFTSPDLKIVSKSCPDDDVSDHKPLVAVIEI